MADIPEYYTEKIEDVGVVKRVFFHLRAVVDGVSTWHYFGVDPAEHPPTTDDPVVEHIYIQFPNDLDNLPREESETALYELGMLVAIKEV